MKKVEKYIYIVIALILVAAISSGVTYILIKSNNAEQNQTPNNDKPLEEDNQPTENLKSGFKLLSTDKVNDTIIQKYELILNSKKQEIDIKYTYEYHEANEDEEAYEEIIGKINNTPVYYNTNILKDSDLKKQTFTENNINKEFNTNNFQLIQGTDNIDYFTIRTNNMNGMYVAPTNGLYIFNDKLENLTNNFPSYDGCTTANYMIIEGGPTGLELENENAWYKDTYGLCKSNENWCHIGVKIENDKIYYLYPKVDFANMTDTYYGYIEEREYTINNNKLEYKTLNTYKIIGAAGQVC